MTGSPDTTAATNAASSRSIICHANQITWVGVVILDHPQPPPDVIPEIDTSRLPVVALLRRDWDFLFDQLRSVSAVVDYLHRAAADGVRALGEEPIRYYELADADEQAAEESDQPWIAELGALQVSRPLLPKAPVSSQDSTGHAVFRIIMEDIASGPFDRDETDRLHLLSMLDRLSVSDRAELGQMLLEQLDQVAHPQPDRTKWRFRRVIQDGARLQLASGVCSQFTDLHREVFGHWGLLRHHDFVESGVFPADAVPWTVAVLLTPRFDGYRPWDTTLTAIHGPSDLSADQVEAIRALWDRETPSA